jgi:ComF family protein
MINDFLSLVYPRLCCICKDTISRNESKWCFKCDLKLPRTSFRTSDTNGANPIFQSLTGQWQLNFAISTYYFKKGNTIQKLLHQFKYHGDREIGQKLGLKMVESLTDTTDNSAIDYIVPVPLHPSKYALRGFNQAEILANVIADETNSVVVTNALSRINATSSQTKKGRYHRWANIDDVFELNVNNELTGKSVLLVDDVFTTGATIAGCLTALSCINNIKISVITLAYADY